MDARTLDEDRAPSLDGYGRMLSDTVNRDENFSFDGNEERDAYETHYQSITEIKVSYPECKNIMVKKELLQKSKTYGEDRWGTLPVHSSIFYGAPLKVIQNLLSSNPNSLKTKDDRGQLPLHLAFRKGDEDLIIEFLKAYPESFYVKDNKGKMPFQCIAQNHKFSETLSELLESYDHLNCIHKSISSKQEKAIAIDDNNFERENASNTEAREEEGRTMKKRLELLNDELSSQEDKRSGTQVLEGAIENLDINLHSQNADYSVALKKIQDLEEQNSELPGLKSTVTELKEQIAMLERRNNTLGKLALKQTEHESVEEMKTQLAASEEHKKLLREHILLLEKEQEENHKAHLEEVQGYKEKLKDLDTSLEIIPTLKEENKRIQELEKKVQDVTEELHGKSEQNSELKENVKDLEEKINRLPSEEDFNEILKNSNEYLEIIMKLKEENKRIPELEKKIQDVNEDLYGKSKQNSKLKESVKDLEEKINRLPSKEDFEEILKDSSEYMEIITNLKEKNMMIPELEKKIQDVTEELYGKSEQNSELKENVKNLEEKINRLPSEDEIQVLLEVKKNVDKTLLETTEKINIKNKENSEMKEKMKILEEMVNRLPSEEETAALQEKMGKMTLKYTDHIKELEREIASKNEDYKKSSERIHQLEDEKIYQIKAMEDLKKTLAGSEQKLSDSSVKFAALQEENKFIPLMITKMNDVIEQLVVKNKENSDIKERAKNLEEQLTKLKDKTKVLMANHEKTMKMISGLLEQSEKRLCDVLKKNSSLEEENSIIPKLNEKIDAIMNYFTITDDDDGDDSCREQSGTTASEKLDIITNHIKKIPSEETFHNFKVQLANLMKSYEKAMELVRVLEEENMQILELKQTIDDMNKELITSSEKCSGLDDLTKENEQLKSSIEKAMKVIAILEEENEGLAVVDDITEENRALKESIKLLKVQISKREKDMVAVLCQNLGVKETTIISE